MLHQIPPKPAYFRAQVLRRLSQAGALALKNSAYLLPHNDESLEDFQWISGEIAQQGGNAWLFRAEAVAGMTDDEIRKAFQSPRAADYQQLLEEVRNLSAQPEEASGAALRKLTRRMQEIRRIDFFDAPGYAELEEAMNEVERQLASTATGNPAVPPARTGGIWVTRQGIKVDRMSSAWLIRRFIDPQAQFRFAGSGYNHQPGEQRFDMFEGEFTHRGDQCTFEVLLAWCALDDAGLRAIAEIVHDLDLKEEKYGRPEAPGVARMITGICARTPSDEDRLALGTSLFDSLYESFR